MEANFNGKKPCRKPCREQPKYKLLISKNAGKDIRVSVIVLELFA